jgi:mercuric ion transport protein
MLLRVLSTSKAGRCARAQTAEGGGDRGGVAAICCFTPALVVLLGVLGLSQLAGVLDYVLLPALLIFVGLIIFALIRKSRAAAERAESR